jgi:hypothetical protein
MFRMKYTLSLIICTCLLLIGGCKKTGLGPATDGTLRLSQCETFDVEGDIITICLEQIISDTRCPINANCIDIGTAKASFLFIKSGKSQSFTLSTNPARGEANIKAISGYLIKFVNLSPYPEIGITPAPAQYRAEMSVWKL